LGNKITIKLTWALADIIDLNSGKVKDLLIIVLLKESNGIIVGY